MFFIIGSPRSGTTLLERILDNHSEIGVCPESNTFCNLVRFNAVSEFSSTWQYQQFIKMTADRLINYNDPAYDCLLNYLEKNPSYKGSTQKLLTDFRVHYLNKKQKRKMGNKTPEDCNFLPIIHKTCPSARYLFIMRHPLDIICSVSRSMALTSKKNPFSDANLIQSSFYVKRCLQNILLKNPIPKHQVLKFRYEDLVDQPEKELKKICHFLGLKYEQNMQHYNVDNYLNLSKKNATMAVVYKNLATPIRNYNIGSYKKKLSPAQINFLYLFFKEEFAAYPFAVPTGRTALNMKQKCLLFKTRLLFQLKRDLWHEWNIRLKIKIKALFYKIKTN